MTQTLTTPVATRTPLGLSPAGTRWHRGVLVVALIALLIQPRTLWSAIVIPHAHWGLLLIAWYGTLLAAAVGAFAVRGTRGLRILDIVALGLGLVLLAGRWVVEHVPTDEGAFTAKAAAAFAAGRHAYGTPWPGLFHTSGIALTETFGGGADYTYAYPPLGAVATAVTHKALPGIGWADAATLTTTIALALAAVALFVLLPPAWRSAGTAVCLGFGTLGTYALRGYPAILAMALLVPVVVGWHRIGAGGRLGRRGRAVGVCLGLAAAAHQLPWFLAPFLLLGLYALRRDGVPLRLAGLSVGTFLLVNVYFIVQSPGAWLSGVLTPLVQHAVPHGQGIVGLVFYGTGGSARLGWLSYATYALLIGLLIGYVAFVRRLGPAAVVLPWCVFYVGIRSQDGYFLLMTPLWLAAVLTVPRGAFRDAWRPRFAEALHRGARGMRVAVAAGLLVPAVACAAVAVASPPPFAAAVIGHRMSAAKPDAYAELSVRVTNRSGDPLAPHFALSDDFAISRWWAVRSGPESLAPGESATYDIVAVVKPIARDPSGFLRLRIFTDGPETLTTVGVPR